MIWKLIRRNVAGKPFRFLLTCSAVTAGVMFTVGVFVFTDGMRAQFGELAEQIEGSTDYAVRTHIEFGDDRDRPPFDPSVAELVAAVDGTSQVQPYVISFDAKPETANNGEGDVYSTAFGTVSLSWPDVDESPRTFIQDGRAPSGPQEFVLDERAAEDGGFEVGEQYRISTAIGVLDDFELVGTFSFASAEESQLPNGITQMAFETSTAIEILNSGAGVNRIEFSIDPTFDPAAVIAEVEAALSTVSESNLEVVDGLQLQEEQEGDFNEFIDVFQTILLSFAIIILAVSAFVIYNVFTILIGQRIRELGLMRAIGATGRQVTRALLGEALIVGIVATVIGTILGIGFGWGQGWLLGRLEFGPGADKLVVSGWTLLWGATVGILVTMASATAPALRARHLSPMAALREDARLSTIVPARNFMIGVPMVVGGWTLLAIGLSIGGDSSWPVWIVVPAFGFTAAAANAYGMRRLHPVAGRFAMLGFGAITIILSVVLNLATGELLLLLAVAAVTLFLGVNAISPTLARPVSNMIGRWPLAVLLGIGGALITVVGGLAVLGSIALIGYAIFNMVTNFEPANVVAVPATLIPLAISGGIFILGRRALDASFILGWRARHVIIAVLVFILGAVGGITALSGIAAIVMGEWAQVIGLPIGAIIVGIAVWARRRWLPKTMKSNARMARENAGRSPRRTASAAAALMIGVALVSTAAVVTESFKLTFADVLAERVISDFFISNENQVDPTTSFSDELATELAALPEVESTVSFRFKFEAFQLSSDGSTRDGSSVELETSFEHFDPGFIDIDRSLVGSDSLWVHEDVAEDAAIAVGDAIAITFNDGSIEPVRVTAIYEDLSIFGSAVVDLSLWERHFPTGQDQFVSVITADGVDIETAREVMEPIIENYPVFLDTRDEFQDRQEGSIDQFLQIFTVLLLAAIAVALLGIAITLALSVFERTRELGLVRAVGMTSQQMMRMVLFEGAIIAAFGGVLGVSLGAVFGAAAVTVIPDTFISQLAIPVGLLVQYMIIASVCGIGAAIIPARRAARLNILDAISQG